MFARRLSTLDSLFSTTQSSTLVHLILRPQFNIARTTLLCLRYKANATTFSFDQDELTYASAKERGSDKIFLVHSEFPEATATNNLVLT